jgi:hypothetical protein
MPHSARKPRLSRCPRVFIDFLSYEVREFRGVLAMHFARRRASSLARSGLR